MPGRPINLENTRARADCACIGCGMELFGFFILICPIIFSSSLPGLRLNIHVDGFTVSGPLTANQPTNKSKFYILGVFPSKTLSKI